MQGAQQPGRQIGTMLLNGSAKREIPACATQRDELEPRIVAVALERCADFEHESAIEYVALGTIEHDPQQAAVLVDTGAHHAGTLENAHPPGNGNVRGDGGGARCPRGRRRSAVSAGTSAERDRHVYTSRMTRRTRRA
jgi:hypothetical protein